MLHLSVPQSQEFWNAGNQRDSKQTVRVFPSWFFLSFSFLFFSSIENWESRIISKTTANFNTGPESASLLGRWLMTSDYMFSIGPIHQESRLKERQINKSFLGRLRFSRDPAIWLLAFRPKEVETQKRFGWRWRRPG